MASAPASPPKNSLRTALALTASCLVTGLLVWWLVRGTTADDWLALWRGLDRSMLAAYCALFGMGVFLRAWRYRLLIRASGMTQPPGVGPLAVVTLVSNLFVDLLPARAGSLAYVVFVTKRLKVDLSAGVSSFAYSFVFDIFGMLPLLLVAAWLHAQESGQPGWALYALVGVLAVGGIAALFLLERILAWAARLAHALAGRLGGRVAELAVKGAGHAEAMASDVARVRGAGVFWPLLLISVAVRMCKYVGLYLLIIGIAGHFGPQVTDALSFGLVLFALLAAEATASLPISGIAGFGAYEGVMGATLLAAGLSQTQAAMIPFGLHLTTQVIDYGLGGLALLYLSATKSKEND